MKRKDGLIPDTKDGHDFCFAAQPILNLPDKVVLRPNYPPVPEQLNIGSSTAVAIANCYKFLLMRAKLPAFLPSRSFIYYNERAIQGTVEQDSGALIRSDFREI